MEECTANSSTLCVLLLLSLFWISTTAAPTPEGQYLTLRRTLGRNRQNKTCSVPDYGATGDGVTFDTDAIQSAIDHCASFSGGGIVRIPKGKYLTGTIFLKSYVTLHVEADATVLGSPFQSDYPRESSRWYVVLAEGASNVGIRGGGVIDGQSSKFVTRLDERKNVMVSWNVTGDCLGDECRPRLVGFLDCVNVEVSYIQLHQPAYWCLHLVRSNNISIHDISIQGDFDTPNNDGIDIEDSNNTVITRCSINTGDDAICPKTSTGPLYNLTATDCQIRTKSSAIKLGSASHHDFVGLVFDNITIVDSHRGLALQIRDEGNVNGVTFSNINISTRYYDPSWWGRAEPIYVTACPRDSNTVVGKIMNVRFINITAISENGIFLSGSARNTLNEIELKNVSVNLRRWTSYEGGFLDYRPGCQGLVHHQTAGFTMENISDIKLQKINLTWANRTFDSDVPLDFTPSTVKNLLLTEFQSSMSS